MPDKPPKVPRRNERPVYGLKTAKNYTTANAVEVILAVPKAKPTAAERYVNKQGYGKVPGYLSQVKADIEMEKEVLQEFMEAHAQDAGESSGGSGDAGEDAGYQLQEDDDITLRL